MDKFNAKLIYKIGDSLYHWTNYVADVERVDILRESAVDYAISEFLEVSKHSNRPKKLPLIKKYKFRFPHPYLVKRSIDLHALTNTPKDNQLYSEFKLVDRSVSNVTGKECQRYFNDLFRLLLAKKYEKKDTLCLFIVAGKKKDFRESFKKENHLRHATGTFEPILSFNDKSRDKSIILSDGRISTFFNAFASAYRWKHPSKSLTNMDTLHTHLSYIKQEDGDFVHVAIWEIDINKQNHDNDIDREIEKL